MGTEYESVARLDGHYAFKQHSRSGVSNRRNRKYHSDRLSHLHEIALRKLTNDPNSALILYIVVDEFRSHHVLDDLVFHNSELGFLNGEAGETLRLSQASQDHGFNDAIDVLLGELGEDDGGSSGLTN